MKLHDITVYSPWDPKVKTHPALSSSVNHYVFIDVTSLRARVARKIYGYLHHDEYYNYFIEYYFEKVYSRLKDENYDYIILENCLGYVVKLSQRGCKNIILHLHNDLLNSNSRYHETVANNLTKVLTVSDYIKKRVSTIVPTNKIETVHNGINLTNFSRKSTTCVNREQMGFSEDDFVMIYSGRVNQEKGVSELIDAMLSIKNISDIKLMIIGGSFFGNTSRDDDFIQSLKKRAEIIKEKIVFTGFLPYNLMPDYYQISDIAVIPSIWDDPFPTTELEAQAMGLPIITTVRGGIPEEVSERNAILLETDNNFVNSLASAILDLYHHPDKRRQMAAASLERAKLFDKESYAKNFFAAIESL